MHCYGRVPALNVTVYKEMLMPFKLWLVCRISIDLHLTIGTHIKHSRIFQLHSYNYFCETTNMRLLLIVLSFCWRWFDMTFPYASTRLQYWLYFPCDVQPNTLDYYHSLMAATLPLYLYLLTRLIVLYLEMTGLLEHALPELRYVTDALVPWLLVNPAKDLFSAILVVIITPGFEAKFFVAQDLCHDLFFTYMSQLACCILSLISTELVAVVGYCWWDNAFAEALAKATLK